ncbi:MAG: nucleoside-diphosphate kinase [Selenomonadaceae bacterium]|nr:nucleoside-diphosphate kinase [Selenomonadaceae bacterium]
MDEGNRREIFTAHNGDATLVLLKPDVVEKNHIGEILAMYERAGLKIIAMRMLQMDEKLAARHYEEHIGRPYYESLVKFMTRSPIVALVLEGEDAIAKVRKLNGATDPSQAEEGTIRKLFAESKTENAVHASDSKQNADREIGIFFG